MAAPNAITAAQLNRLIGTPDCPQIVDVSIDPDFADDPFLIPGSWRHPHSDLPGLRARLQGRAAIVTCQKGIKLNQGLVCWPSRSGFRGSIATITDSSKPASRSMTRFIAGPATASPKATTGPRTGDRR